jgi:hypothetical protein
MDQPISVDIVDPPTQSRRSPPTGRILLLALAGLFGAFLLWVRGTPSFVAWEVARDHQRCFGRRHLAARLYASDAREIRDWLESRGTPVQPLPDRAGNVEIVGVRYCPLVDRIAAHIYYGGEGSLVSVFVLSGATRIGSGWSGMSRGLQVRLFPSAGRTVCVVGESARDVDAVARAFLTSVARLTVPAPPASLSCSLSVGL